MPTLPVIDTAERRRRIGARHHLAPGHRDDDAVTVAREVVGIHATDPASVYIGLRARVAGLTHADIARSLYEERSLLKILGMRRTMFVAPIEGAAVIHAATATDIAARERRRTSQMLADAGIAADPEAWVAALERETMDALHELGEATATELTKHVPGLREQIEFGAGKKWAGKVGVSTRLLFLLAAEGRIIRGRPRGTWLSSLYRWVPMDRWVEGGLEPWPPERAQAELVRRWLAAFGPGTQKDIQWWTGWTVARTRAALAAVGAIEARLDDGRPAFVLPADTETTPEQPPWVALLPALDTTTMAWNERPFYLDGHAGETFDTIGNAGPTIWADGRVVGIWAQRPSGEVVTRLLEDVGREAEDAVEAEAAALTSWLGGDRVFPRFPNPAFQALAGS